IQDLLIWDRILYGIFPGAFQVEPSQMGAAADLLAQLMRDGAHISSLGTSNAEYCKRLLIFTEAKIIDVDQTRLSLHLHSFSGQFVERNAFLFHSGDHWRHLEQVADECASSFVQL